MTNAVRGGFDEGAARSILEPLLRSGRVKGNKDTFLAAADFLNLLVEETLQRCKIEAERDSAAVITIDHFRRVLPQLLLDFC